MGVYEIIFSPTGGTQKISEMFAEAFLGEKTVCDLTDRTADFGAFDLNAEDICIVSVPSYGGRVPQIAAERLRQLTGNGAAAVLLVVYGNRAYDDTLVELYDILTERGFRYAAGVAAVAEHSIVRQFAAGRPNEADGRTLADFALKIRENIARGSFADGKKLPGNRPYKKYGVRSMKIETADACSRCGICAEKCPVGAIEVQNPSETDAAACIGCMRCVSVCPNHARAVSSEMLSGLSQKLAAVCADEKPYELYLE